MTKKFSKELLLDELCVLDKPLLDEVVDTSRWSIHHRVVFEAEGKFWEAHYSVGATEQQDESPWEHEDEVECTEVHKVPKTVEVWEPVA